MCQLRFALSVILQKWIYVQVLKSSGNFTGLDQGPLHFNLTGPEKKSNGSYPLLFTGIVTCTCCIMTSFNYI